jgi:diketogulonate reductase-like aldo/keto reductase
MREHGIEVASFNGLTPITKARPGPLDGPLSAIASNHNAMENAVLIRWQMEQNVAAVTTTTKLERVSEYLKAIDLSVSTDELDELARVGLSHHLESMDARPFRSR